MVRLTRAAAAALGHDEVLGFTWHRIATCCASVGEVGLSVPPRRVVQRHPDRYTPRTSEPPARGHAAQAALAHLAGRPVPVDGGRRFGVRRFVSDLPTDVGLRPMRGRSPRAR